MPEGLIERPDEQPNSSFPTGTSNSVRLFNYLRGGSVQRSTHNKPGGFCSFMVVCYGVMGKAPHAAIVPAHA